MVELVPAIHVFVFAAFQDVDARDKRGHDESESGAVGIRQRVARIERSKIREPRSTTIPHFASLNAGYLLLRVCRADVLAGPPAAARARALSGLRGPACDRERRGDRGLASTVRLAYHTALAGAPAERAHGQLAAGTVAAAFERVPGADVE
jgi:hypothetical protein